jgi:hypothetical protein
MNRLEDELRSALRRREPPPGFAERVMARVPVTMPARRRPTAVWRWVAAAAACLVMVAGIDSYRDYRRGVEAKQQALLALRITEEKLAVVRNKLVEVNRSELE